MITHSRRDKSLLVGRNQSEVAKSTLCAVSDGVWIPSLAVEGCSCNGIVNNFEFTSNDYRIITNVSKHE